MGGASPPKIWRLLDDDLGPSDDPILRILNVDLLLEEVEGVRHGDWLVDDFQGEAANKMGDGNGVISVKAASCGDEKTELGEIDPAHECAAARAVRILGARRGKLVEDILARRGMSGSRGQSGDGTVGWIDGRSVHI